MWPDAKGFESALIAVMLVSGGVVANGAFNEVAAMRAPIAKSGRSRVSAADIECTANRSHGA
jgi:hypothetical protein